MHINTNCSVNAFKTENENLHSGKPDNAITLDMFMIMNDNIYLYIIAWKIDVMYIMHWYFC